MIRRSWLNRVAAVVLAVLFAAMPAVALAGDPIDVGAAATDRASAYSILFLSYTQKTLVSGTNPANDAGTIDTVEVWFNLKDGDAYASVATFTDNGSNSLTANDSEEIGSPASGSKQTVTGLDIDIDSGEYIGIVGHTDDDSGKYSIEFDYNSASSTTWFYNGDATSGTNTFNTTAGSETDMSLYGTGETAGGTPDISNTPSTENLGIVGASTTVYAKGSSPSNPVGDSDCTFTVTNNSGAAVNIDIKGANWTGGVGCTIETLAELIGDTPKVAFDHYGREWGQHYQDPLWAAIGEDSTPAAAAEKAKRKRRAVPKPKSARRTASKAGLKTPAKQTRKKR